MQARLRTWRLSAAAVLSSIALIAGVSCNDDCENGIWLTGTEPVCTAATGSVNVAGPAQYALPATLPAVDGNTCFDAAGTCMQYPVVHLANTVGRGQYGIELILRLPAVEGSATYTFPTAWTVNFFNLNVQLNAMDSSGMPSGQNLEWVAGTIVVEVSSPAELRVTFDLQLLLPSGEMFSITGGPVTVSGCYVKETKQCVPRGND